MKTIYKDIIRILFALIVPLFIFSACNKDNEETENENPVVGTTDFNVSLKSTVAKSTYDSILIDIQAISIHTSSDSAENSGWFELETNVGIYDLLDYDAGNDTLIAFDSVLQTQTVSQIRLILGENNTIGVDGEIYDLETPSAQTSGLKIQVHAELEADKSYKILLDFDADNSIIETGNGKYKLKPVIDTSVIEEG